MTWDSDYALASELIHFTGLVAGGDLKGGSGTCVQLDDGSIALLTARHVVWECLRNTGRVGIAAFGAKFQEPKLIRMDSSQQGDAAYLVFKDPPVGAKAVPFADWTRNRTDLAVGLRVLVCGYSSALKQADNNKVVSTLAWLGDRILAIQGNRVVSGIGETLEGIPRTFEGLSGAGLFSDDARFIGVVVEEKRRLSESQGELYSLLPEEFPELYTPFSLSIEAPIGRYQVEHQHVGLTLLNPEGGVLATIRAMAQYVWSRTAADHQHGRIGRLLSLEFIIPGIQTRYPVSMTSTFTWAGNTNADMLNAAEEELKFLLLRMRWLVREGPDGEITLQVRSQT